MVPDEILVTIKQALETASRNAETEKAAVSSPINGEAASYRSEPVKEKGPVITVSGEYIFGDTPVFRQILQQIDLVAPTNYTVIIHGESGSGKEAIAQEIHKRSKRKGKPFVAIDCGALSKELAGSELF